MDEIIQVERPGEGALLVSETVQAVLDSCASPHTRRAYERALRDFLAWCQADGRRRFQRATVQRHVASLREGGLGAAGINQRLAAIKRFAAEAAEAGHIEQETARAIEGIKGAKQAGQRRGNWLTVEQATQLLRAPDVGTVRGQRDRAMLALLAGCGLRRSEIVSLTWAHVQQREGRWCIVDLRGKGNKVRTVPMPGWAKGALDGWQGASGAKSGPIFRPIDRYGNVGEAGITAQTVRAVVVKVAAAVGLEGLAPHDLRRTFAKLAIQGGAEWDQLQMSLGHASIATTQRYVGLDQDLSDAPGDRLGIEL